MAVSNEWDIKSFDFPLTADSVVMELGGYRGRWCGEINRLYHPQLYVYEPQKWAYDILWDMFENTPNVRFFNYGLGTSNAILPMGEYGTDGCSFLPAGREQGTGKIHDWYEELEQRGINSIDLLLVNIEGYEFTLLPYLYPMLHQIKWLMVQFHLGVGGSDHTAEYHAIREQLSHTHNILWDYGPTLVCWEIKG